MSMTSQKVTAQNWNVTPEQEQSFRASDATLDWLCSLPEERIRQYVSSWVAAKDCRILATAVTFDVLLEQLKDTDLSTVVIHRFEKPGCVIYR